MKYCYGYHIFKTKILPGILAAAVAALSALSINLAITQEGVKLETKIELSGEQVPGYIYNDMGEIEEIEIPTVESIDGGRFEDINTGLSISEGEYADLGWSELYDTSTFEAFKNATLGTCIYANNRFGAQCVSLERVFWWSYADRDVSTCGTGMAKGMMDCAEQNAGDDFEIHWGSDGFGDVAGDVGVWGTGIYGHTASAVGPIRNGYVAVLGENQGGKPCEFGGAATNIINLSINGLIGYYRPIRYIPEPEPAPTPITPDTGVVK